MRIEFTYQFEDVREALHPDAARRRSRALRRIISIVSWSIFVLSMAFIYWLRQFTPSRPWALDGMPLDLISDVLPSALLGTFVCALMIIVAWKAWRGSRVAAAEVQPGKTTASARIIGGLLGFSVAGAIYLLIKPDWVIPWTPTRTQRILLSAGPMAVVILLLIMAGKLQQRWTAARHWVSKPGWKRPKVLELDATGYHISDALSRQHYAWASFVRARETGNLFILMAEDAQQYVVPKRAFSGPEELQQCRSLLQSMIAKTDFLVQPTGFEVIPKPVLPLAAASQPPSESIVDPIPIERALQSSQE
jgi:hypothetical protein